MTRQDKRLAALAAALVVLALAWPGDAPWINDEPRLFVNALAANQQGRLATLGLEGTFGLRYGPPPTWFYQAALLLTRNPIWIGLIKNALCLGVLAFGLLGLARRLKYPRAPLLLVLLSPYLYIYNRTLWDNCFLIPLMPLAVYCYLRLVEERRLRWLWAGVGLGVLALHVHLMAALVLAPVAGCLLVGERKWLRQRWPQVLAALATGALACLPYALAARSGLRPGPEFEAGSFLATLGGLVTGIEFFSFVGLSHFLPEHIQDHLVFAPVLVRFLLLVSGLSFLFFGVGVAAAVRGLARRRRQGEPLATEDKLAALCLAILALVIVFYLGLRPEPQPHYANAVWFAYFFFIWRGVVCCARAKARRLRLAPAAHAAAMLVLLAGMAAHIHGRGGNRGWTYGATLGNQRAIARRLVLFSPQSPKASKVYNNLRFPHALLTLCVLSVPPDVDPAALPRTSFQIDYRDANSTSGWMTITESRDATEDPEPPPER